MITLGEIASISTGYTFRPDPNAPAHFNVSVLQAKDIAPNLVANAGLTQFYLAPSKIRYLDNGAVVLSARGSFRAAAFDREDQVMASSSVYIINLKSPQHMPEFISAYLNAPTSQSYFAQNSTGSSIKTLLIDTLRQLPVPDIPLDRQALYVGLHQNLMRQRAILERKTALNQSILNQSLTAIEGAIK